MVYPLVENAKLGPEAPLVADCTTQYTREEFNSRVNRAISLLRQQGASQGDAVAIMATNSCNFATMACATALSGVSLVPVNWHLKADEAGYILRQSGARMVFASSDHLPVAQRAGQIAGGLRVVELGTEFETELGRQSAAEPPSGGVYATQIYFTSGTTGRPKATKMAQMPEKVSLEQAVANLRALAKRTGTSAVEPAHRHLVTGPMYHAAPLHHALQAMMNAAPMWIMPRFDPEQTLQLIERHRITHLMLAPIMFSRLLQLPHATRQRYDVSSLQCVQHLGAPAPVSVKQAMIDWWGPIFVDAYGASEIGTVTRISCEEWLRKPGSVGRPMDTLTIQIIRDGEEARPGEVGEIYITSLTGIDLEYVDDPEKTRQAHRGDKQFTLGDLGWLDEDGYLFLADRRVDMINSGGVNIYPAEIEAALIEHPSVADVGVIGVPHPEWGQEVKAIVQLREGYQPSKELEQATIQWLRERISTMKVPRSIEYREHLPRYPNGKLHRRELRAPYWDKDDLLVPG